MTQLAAVAGIFDLPPPASLPWNTRALMAREIGRIRQRRDGHWQVDVSAEGRRYRLGSARILGSRTWVSLETEQMAREVLYAVRARYAAGLSLEASVAPFQRRGSDATTVEAVADRFVERETARCAAGDISPATLRDLRRIVAKEFARWHGIDVHGITYRELEEWRAELGRRVSAKTARNILGELRRMLRWLHRCGELAQVPEFPEIPVDTRAPEILRPDEQAAVLAAIPKARRGVFLAMAHTLRENEARALDLFHWREPYLIVQQACKLPTAAAPIRGLKERDWKVIGATDDLCAWITWRLRGATPEERLRRVGVPLFPNPSARNEGKRWSAWAIREEWVRACRKAGVRYVSPYPSTRHSTATDLLRTGRATVKQVQTLLGHRAASSTERYAVLAGGDVQDILRRWQRNEPGS